MCLYMPVFVCVHILLSHFIFNSNEGREVKKKKKKKNLGVPFDDNNNNNAQYPCMSLQHRLLPTTGKQKIR